LLSWTRSWDKLDDLDDLDELAEVELETEVYMMGNARGSTGLV
jgi:hypothetical protein